MCWKRSTSPGARAPHSWFEHLLPREETQDWAVASKEELCFVVLPEVQVGCSGGQWKGLHGEEISVRIFKKELL